MKSSRQLRVISGRSLLPSLAFWQIIAHHSYL